MSFIRHACFDGLVGGTHHYAGLAEGNLASLSNVGRVASPREAALQGLEKMKAVAELGVVQGVLPPHERPRIDLLRALGFEGNDARVLEKAARAGSRLLGVAYSASAMWAANAATVTPSVDSADGRLHLTAANLSSTLHRSLEAEQTSRALRRIFPDETRFAHHDPLPTALGDEGAANHTRLLDGAGRGAHLFVYGGSLWRRTAGAPHRFSARQHREASEAIARRHQIPIEQCLFLQQSPKAIDAGVFHADVILVGEGHLLLYHEEAFADDAEAIGRLEESFGLDTEIGRVHREELSVDEAVRSYLFNSQLITNPDGTVTLIAPVEANESPTASRVIDRWLADERNPIAHCSFLDLRQSMQNGGGPACLRLRVPLAPAETEALHTPALLDETLYEKLREWVYRHHRDQLRLDDLADPQLIDEGRRALDELTQILELGSDFYPFQRGI